MFEAHIYLYISYDWWCSWIHCHEMSAACGSSLNLQCMYCLEDLEDLEIPCVLPCTHMACISCLKSALAQSRKIICPDCRFVVVFPFPHAAWFISPPPLPLLPSLPPLPLSLLSILLYLWYWYHCCNSVLLFCYRTELEESALAGLKRLSVSKKPTTPDSQCDCCNDEIAVVYCIDCSRKICQEKSDVS